MNGCPKSVWNLRRFLQFEEVCQLTECCDDDYVCHIPNGFLVTGGQRSDRCSMYIIISDRWTQLEPLPLPRNGHAAIFINRKIYVFGGFVTGSKSASVLSLKLDDEEWNVEPDLPFPVCYPEVAFMATQVGKVNTGNFFVDMVASVMATSIAETFGSYTGIFLLDVQSTNQLVFFDMKTNTWHRHSALPGESCWGAKMITDGNNLVVAGGRNKILAVYNPILETWVTAKRPLLEHHLGTAIVHQKKLFLIGGKNEDSVEVYNEDADSWSVLDVKLPHKVNDRPAVSSMVQTV